MKVLKIIAVILACITALALAVFLIYRFCCRKEYNTTECDSFE